MSNGPTLGIDFGTTNSCVAVASAFGGPRSVVVATGDRPPFDTVLRSAVIDPESDDWLVGNAAVEASQAPGAKARRYLASFKPLLDEHQLRHRVQERITVGTRFDMLEQIDVLVQRVESVWYGGEDRFSREELTRSTAIVISRLLQCALADLGEADASGLGDLWFGMPVSFSSCARKRLLAALRATWDDRGAALFRGYKDLLRRVRFVLEPVAVAAVAMEDAVDQRDGETVLVFDHGGGTLDLSLIRYEYLPEFDALMPVRELAAGGSREVAGASIDRAFRSFLERRDDIREVIAPFSDAQFVVDGSIEQAKIQLSEDATGNVLGVEVSRDELNRSIADILDEIDGLIAGTVAGAGMSVRDVDRVVATGGSSLVPAVQERLRATFGHLDEYHLLTYDPQSLDARERAITEVSRGLVTFAERVSGRDFFEQVVLWDLHLRVSGQKGRIPVARRGEPYERAENNQPVLRRDIPIDPCPGRATAFGLYDVQLGHERYVFGAAEIPPLPRGGVLRIELRPDSATPKMVLVDDRGRPMTRDVPRGRWESERLVAADLFALTDDRELAEFFDDDADYWPVRGFLGFESSPLVRPLRVGDIIEWAQDRDGAGPRRDVTRFRGRVQDILRVEDWSTVDAMADFDLDAYRFTIALDKGGIRRRRSGGEGCLRLAARLGRDF